MTQNRQFPRVRMDQEILYEFVSWKETSLKKLSSPKAVRCHDISASGIGLAALPEVSLGILRKLEDGTMKVRLSVKLEDLPVYLFARLVWVQIKEPGSDQIERAGFTFLDISKDNFETIKAFVEKNLST